MNSEWQFEYISLVVLVTDSDFTPKITPNST